MIVDSARYYASQFHLLLVDEWRSVEGWIGAGVEAAASGEYQPAQSRPRSCAFGTEAAGV
ncbi:MAG: hypothetical protein VKJ04_07385 [Vampirovibrionales bacterium]|nr:hypothetical protein [Vampirovibrionales bacterium]